LALLMTLFRKLRSLLPEWLFGAFCLLVPALYNGFPLVTSDSGGYISNSQTLYLPIDRPVAYSLLIRICSLGISLWGVVFTQALLLSGLLLFIIRSVMGSAYRRRAALAIMLLIGITTSAGWSCGQLTPDIFTAILLLSICILAFLPASGTGKWLLYLLMLGCMLVHNSNLLTGTLLAAVLLVYSWRAHKKELKKTAIALLSISIAGWLALSTMNAVAGRGFRPSNASHVFIMSRMVENGIADAYLEKYCPNEPSTLCGYRGKLPQRQWDFMWDSSSALYRAGGWQATEAEYSRIIRRTLMQPRFLAMHIVKNATATMCELPLIQAGEELAPLGEGSSPYQAIQKLYKDESKEYAAARQQAKDLKLDYWNILILLFALSTSVAALLLTGRTANHIKLRSMILLSLLFLLINAAVTATFATVVSRYEARVFWVLPFLAALYIIRSYGVRQEVYEEHVDI
jgi:4-amino-4-deoxy-L-arabinose transferase-like glycosyltransferase